jgi:3-phenylpropionate/cinnamic acid dioxygenase small subunit
MAVQVDEADDRLFNRIQRFLYREAALLDKRQFDEWISLFLEDASYRLTAQVSRDGSASPVDFTLIDDEAARFRARVAQVANPKLTHAENPPSLTRRFISTVDIAPDARRGSYVVTSSILVYRNRPSVGDEGFYVGGRSDVLTLVGDDFKIAQREVRLDQVQLQGQLSTFF